MLKASWTKGARPREITIRTPEPRTTLFVSDKDLALIKKQVPKTPQYLAKDQRGGVLARPWNLIVPAYLAEGREPDESQR